MRIQRSALHQWLVLSLMVFGLLLTGVLAIAQDDPPAPQFLVRSDNRLLLVDGYTGEATELPFVVREFDQFEWSPDGRYVLARLHEGEAGKCLNLFDINAWDWLYEEPISCAVGTVTFSPDDTQVLYTSIDGDNEVLWLHSLVDQSNQELHRTTDGEPNREAGLWSFQWSPTEDYLTFVSYKWIMGGTLNTFVVMNAETGDYVTLSAPDPYYADYRPVWSPDDGWFLITLQDEYVVGSSLPRTNHQGDVYLVNSETGDRYRLTYTPATHEGNVRWTDEGGITFSVRVVLDQQYDFTLEQAMNVPEVLPEDIVMPEPIDFDAHLDEHRSGPPSDVIISPDSYVGAWVSSTPVEHGGQIYELHIGQIYTNPRRAVFTLQLPDSYRSGDRFIGWRPTDYSYPIG